MATDLEEPPTRQSDHAQRLRTSMAAMRLSFTWFGTRKSLSSEQKTRAADTFHAEGKFLSAGKKLINTSDSSFRAVTSVRTQAMTYLKAMSLPYPEPGIRLISQGSLDRIDEKMRCFREELAEAVAALDVRFDELKHEARHRLGDLFCESDYPASLHGLFEINWDFPSVEPPEYLRRLNPELYQQECERVRSRFDEAVQMAESAFIDELSKLIDHLSERLTGGEDGKPKIFRDTAVSNLTEFFERFQRLNIGSNEELDHLVERAQNVVDGVAPQRLRDSSSLRKQIGAQISAVQSSLDGLLVDRPRRNIIRSPK